MRARACAAVIATALYATAGWAAAADLPFEMRKIASKNGVVFYHGVDRAKGHHYCRAVIDVDAATKLSITRGSSKAFDLLTIISAARFEGAAKTGIRGTLRRENGDGVSRGLPSKWRTLAGEAFTFIRSGLVGRFETADRMLIDAPRLKLQVSVTWPDARRLRSFLARCDDAPAGGAATS